MQYILDGKTPVLEPDLIKWGMWLESGNRHVGDDTLTTGERVSTVFLGVDHQFGDGPPLLFESMVFNSDRFDGDMIRYSTWEEAEAGHQFILDVLSGKSLMDTE